MMKFIIYGVQRSGTSYVGSLLDSHPDIIAMGEPLCIPVTGSLCYENTHRYPQYLKKYNKGDNEETFYEYFESIYSSLDANAIGFKLMHNQISQYPYILKYLREHSFKMICIKRTNILKRYLSDLQTQKTGMYGTTKKDKLRVGLVVPIETLLERLDSYAEQLSKWEASIDEFCLPSIVVQYESLNKHLSYECEQLMSFLSVDSTISLSSELIKINTDELSDLIENYKDVRQLLLGTPYESCLF